MAFGTVNEARRGLLTIRDKIRLLHRQPANQQGLFVSHR